MPIILIATAILIALCAYEIIKTERERDTEKLFWKLREQSEIQKLAREIPRPTPNEYTELLEKSKKAWRKRNTKARKHRQNPNR